MSAAIEIKVPDIGDFKDVPIIEIHVKPGDTVRAEDPLITLESDKATMDVPSPAAGIVRELKVGIGDKVAEGSPVLLLEIAETATAVPPPIAAPAPVAAGPTPVPPAASPAPSVAAESAPIPATALAAYRPTEAEPTTLPPRVHIPSPAEFLVADSGLKAHASPSVRRFARELGVDVGRVAGTGPKGRITQADVQTYVKNALAGAANAALPAATGAATGSGLQLLPWPQVDFAKFGPVEYQPLSRIKKISGPNLVRNWVMIPAVTYHEDADITDLEAFRVRINQEREKSGNKGSKLTMLAFLIKAVVVALQKYPELNSSLDGEQLVLKRYWNIGFAADTPHGLMVPVLKDAERKSIGDIADETSALARKAREGKLAPAEMNGASFTISSLGGIGGTYFSPIVNAPEVAILGVNKAAIKPVWDGQNFQPRLMLPLSLSADHRVIDGALATRFNVLLAELLADFRRVML